MGRSLLRDRSAAPPVGLDRACTPSDLCPWLPGHAPCRSSSSLPRRRDNNISFATSLAEHTHAACQVCYKTADMPPLMTQTLEGIAGVVLVAAILLDVFLTGVVPRRSPPLGY